ncbi:MAG: AbrB family transcriptional regulator [Verrucomicrobiota bacterium]
MVKEIRKIGNSKGIILDAAILDALKVDVGDKVEITINGQDSVRLTPVGSITNDEFNDALNEVLDDYKDTLSKLA